MISAIKRRVRSAVNAYGYDIVAAPRTVARRDPEWLPGILVASIPKSGTVYVNNLLSRGLNVPSVSVGLNYFPRDLADIARTEALAKGGRVAASHLPPSSQNLRILGTMLGRWVVHVRDPRSVVVSLAHHLDRLMRIRPNDMLMIDPAPHPSYLTMSVKRKIEWVVDNHLNNIMIWTRDWLEVANSGRYNICLTSYDELHHDETAFIYRILDFFQIPRTRYEAPRLEKKTEVTHYRKGLIDEWRVAFGTTLLVYVNELIGRDVLDFFNWPLT